MSKTKKTVLSLGMIVLVMGVTMIFAESVSAYQGDPAIKGPNYSTERHAAMEKAFETNDYTAWKNLMQNKGRVTQVINKDNFAKFAQAHTLAEKGDMVGSQKIKQELGLGLKNGGGRGMRGMSQK
ncbi:MAG: hypothetical protein AB1333_03985 [Patescibacteria group bacterium]